MSNNPLALSPEQLSALGAFPKAEKEALDAKVASLESQLEASKAQLEQIQQQNVSFEELSRLRETDEKYKQICGIVGMPPRM